MWLTQYMEGITLRSKDKYNNKIYYTSDKINLYHIYSNEGNTAFKGAEQYRYIEQKNHW